MARILALANQKGGVAKTTSAVSLAACLVERGRRVLLVDLDAQACATFCLGWDPEDLERSCVDVLIGDRAGNVRLRARSVILETDDVVDLMPASLDLAAAEQALAGAQGREYVLREVLAHCLDYVAAPIVGVQARFSAPFFPGETLRVRLWREPHAISFDAESVERSVTVLSHGRVGLRIAEE